MGSWMVETFFNTDDTQLLASAFRSVFAFDGYYPVTKPNRDTCEARNEHRVYDRFEREDLGGIVLIPGNRTGWTYVLVDPARCLHGRPQGVPHPRLAEIARQSNCKEFMICTYDSCNGTLLESLQDGTFHVSGSTIELSDDIDSMVETEGLSEDDLQSRSFPFFSELIPYSETGRPQFRLLQSLMEFNQKLNESLDIAVWTLAPYLAGVEFAQYSEWSELHRPFMSYRMDVTELSNGGQWCTLEPDFGASFDKHVEEHFDRTAL